jgi:hypothetical protein
MLLFPVIMNAIQYYIIDIFIKKPVSQYVVDDTIGDAVTDDDALRREALLAGLDESYATDSEYVDDIILYGVHDDWEKKHDEENLDSSVAFCPPYACSSSSSSYLSLSKSGTGL